MDRPEFGLLEDEKMALFSKHFIDLWVKKHWKTHGNLLKSLEKPTEINSKPRYILNDICPLQEPKPEKKIGNDN